MMTLLPGRAANKVLAEADGMHAQGGDSGPTALLPSAALYFGDKLLKRWSWSACVFLEAAKTSSKSPADVYEARISKARSSARGANEFGFF